MPKGVYPRGTQPKLIAEPPQPKQLEPTSAIVEKLKERRTAVNEAIEAIEKLA